jgi:hypothetical protein
MRLAALCGGRCPLGVMRRYRFTGFPEAIEATWPHSIVQTCTVHYADLRIMPISVRSVGWC